MRIEEQKLMEVAWTATPGSSQTQDLAWLTASEAFRLGFRHGERGEYARPVLLVRFRNGGLYAYDGVPVEVADEVREAPSVGRALNLSVKGKYAFEKVEPFTRVETAADVSDAAYTDPVWGME
jgi:hypothetical protein